MDCHFLLLIFTLQFVTNSLRTTGHWTTLHIVLFILAPQKLQSLQLYSFGLFNSGMLPATLAASGLDWLGRYQRDFIPFIYYFMEFMEFDGSIYYFR